MMDSPYTDDMTIIFIYIAVLCFAIVLLGIGAHWLDTREEKRLRKELDKNGLKPFSKTYRKF